jgi:hypothetical protein
MAARRGTPRTATTQEWDAPEAPKRRGGWAARWRTPRVIVALAVVGVLVVAGSIGGVLYALGILAPFPRVTTLAELPAPLAPAAYSRVAVDGAGLVWVAQSAPGLARQPADSTVLTIVDPDQHFGDRVQARLCLGCAGNADVNGTAPSVARIDDIAPDLHAPHAIFVAGWTAPQGQAPGVPVVLRVAWHAGMASCDARHICADVSTILDPTTTVAYVNTPANPNTPLLQQLLNVGVAPVLSLAALPGGDLLCFLSDRGRDSLQDPEYNVVGGFQGLLRWDHTAQSWAEVYIGPGGSRATQHLSPTSTVTALAVDRAGRFVYLADSDHQAIYRMELADPNLGSASPYVAAGAVQRIAGEPLAGGAYADLAQAVPGWSGDGGPALMARLNAPRGLAMDDAGDLIVSDAGNDRLRLITPGGTIWSVAGNGAPEIGGDGGAPLDAGLRGVLGIAAGTGGRIYAIQGATPDGSGAVRLLALAWGWTTPRATVMRATTGGQGFAAEAVAGLAQSNTTTQTATLLTAQGATTCASGLILARGGALPDQSPLALPSQLPAPPCIPGTPVAAARAPGTDVIIVAQTQPAQIAFLPDAASSSTAALPAPIALPTGATPTGLAVLLPTTDAQLAYLGAGYILVPVRNASLPPQLLVYKTAPETCGATGTSNCQHFPGTPALAATLTFANATDVGAVTALLSDDGHHAFALVAHPQAGIVSAIDFTSWLAYATPLAVATTITVPAPVGALALRHDGLAAYIGAGQGQIATVPTANWLATGIPATASASLGTLGPATAPTTALAISEDDARLVAAFVAANGASSIALMDIGGFGQPASPQRATLRATSPHLAALTLAAADARLLSAAPGTLGTWLTHDPATPTQWLAMPTTLGAIPAAGTVLAIIAG